MAQHESETEYIESIKQSLWQSIRTLSALKPIKLDLQTDNNVKLLIQALEKSLEHRIKNQQERVNSIKKN
jgi:hypothetical protein